MYHVLSFDGRHSDAASLRVLVAKDRASRSFRAPTTVAMLTADKYAYSVAKSDLMNEKPKFQSASESWSACDETTRRAPFERWLPPKIGG